MAVELPDFIRFDFNDIPSEMFVGEQKEERGLRGYVSNFAQGILSTLHLSREAPSTVNRFSQDECGICKSDLSSQINVLACGHIFHKDCLSPWLLQQRICPIDRQKIQAPISRIHLPLNQTIHFHPEGPFNNVCLPPDFNPQKINNGIAFLLALNGFAGLFGIELNLQQFADRQRDLYLSFIRRLNTITNASDLTEANSLDKIQQAFQGFEQEIQPLLKEVVQLLIEKVGYEKIKTHMEGLLEQLQNKLLEVIDKGDEKDIVAVREFIRHVKDFKGMMEQAFLEHHIQNFSRSSCSGYSYIFSISSDARNLLERALQAKEDRSPIENSLLQKLKSFKNIKTIGIASCGVVLGLLLNYWKNYLTAQQESGI